MKKTVYILSALLVFSACNKQAVQVASEAPAADELVSWTFSSVSVKAGIADAGTFSWAAGDQIAIWDNTTGAHVNFTTKTAKGVFTATAPRSSEFVGAIYPAAVASGASAVTLPDSYTVEQAAAGTTFPMFAPVNEGTNALAFTHLGALLRFTLTGVGAGMDEILIVSSDGSISGSFSFDSSNPKPTIALLSGGSGAVSIAIAPEAASSYNVTIPVPTGSYNYEIQVLDGTNVIYRAYTESSQTFERAKIYKLGELPFYEANVLLQSGLEGEDFSVEQDDPYAWQ